MGFKHRRPHMDGSLALKSLDMAARWHQTFGGGSTTTALTGLLMPIFRSIRPFKNVPPMSQDSTLRSKTAATLRSKRWMRRVAVVDLVVSKSFCLSRHPRAHKRLFTFLVPLAIFLNFRTHRASMITWSCVNASLCSFWKTRSCTKCATSAASASSTCFQMPWTSSSLMSSRSVSTR